MRKLPLLLPVFLFAAACASSPQSNSRSTEPRVLPPTVTSEGADPAAEATELRLALEQAYAQIAARSDSKRQLALVDADAGLSIEIPQHHTIDGAVRYFSTGLKESIQGSLYRSAEYKQLIDAVLDEYELPRAFSYLPVIESAYHPTLSSRVGARGIWQLMPATAREYGLRVDYWVDERTNPEKSTRVAAKFIKDLWNQFHDWPLVLAAYNAGPGRVRRTLTAQEASTFWQLLEQGALPKETRGYVPTFFATLMIVSDPETYGFELVPPVEHKEKSVPVTGPVSLTYLAEVTNTPVEKLKKLNTEFRHGIIPPGRSKVKVPEEAASLLAAKADSLRYEDPHVAVATYTLRGSDSLTRLAKLIGKDKEEILEMNGLSSADSVRPGESIYLPVQQAALSNILRGQYSRAPNYYTVAAGDTLYSISKRHSLTVEELIDLNRLATDAPLQPGQQLRVSLGTSLPAGGM
jgi:membrane-bound lytic murein transglycosylase D